MRVPFSWGGSAFHTYLSMIEGPMCQLLTVKNLPPPLFSEGNFITVHREIDSRALIQNALSAINERKH